LLGASPESILPIVVVDSRRFAAPRNDGGGSLATYVGAAGVALTADDLGEIERAVAAITVQGARYPEHLQQLVDR
jgi:hypothetical protein